MKASRDKDFAWNNVIQIQYGEQLLLAIGRIVSLPLRKKKPKVLNSVSEKFDVMVNFMYWPDYAMGCPDIWSNVIVSVSGIWDKFNRLNKTDALRNNGGGPHLISWRPE